MTNKEMTIAKWPTADIQKYWSKTKKGAFTWEVFHTGRSRFNHLAFGRTRKEAWWYAAQKVKP